MCSMVMHNRGSFDEAPMNSTTFGCRSVLITRIFNEATLHFFHHHSGRHHFHRYLRTLPGSLVHLTKGDFP